MRCLKIRNVNDSFHDMLWWVGQEGRVEKTRNGLAKVMPYPVLTRYTCPWEKVLFHPERDANPFFHVAEAIWILAGSDKLDFIAYFNSNMNKYSDDGETIRGAYGHRWRKHFNQDQLLGVIAMLKQEPGTRQAVLTMWDPEHDLGAASKDIPCNTHIYFRINKGHLETTVCCRSNDMIWGAYGANAVHFGFLHEFMAGALDMGMGPLYQFSNNFHVYEQHWPLLDNHLHTNSVNPYELTSVVPLFDRENANWQGFLEDCEDIVTRGSHATPQNFFLTSVFMPMLRIWEERKYGEPYQDHLNIMMRCDWKEACKEWLDRRKDRASK